MDRRSNHKVSLVNLDKIYIITYTYIYFMISVLYLKDNQFIYGTLKKKYINKLKIHVYTSQHAKHQ